MAELPCQIRLAAGDYFMHGQDHHMRRLGLPGNVCRVALKVDGGLDDERLRRRVANSELLQWLGRMHIARPLPVFPPVWRTACESRTILYEQDAPKVNGHEPGQPPVAVLERDLHAARGPGFALDLVRYPDESRHLVLSWNHALMDVRGAELVLRHLNAGAPAEDERALANLLNPAQQQTGFRRWWQNLKAARGSMAWLRESGREPLFTLMSPSAPPGLCRGLTRAIFFSREETGRIQARCEHLNAGFRRSQLYLAASIRGLHAVASARGNKDGAYLVPVPHDMRRRGSQGPIFSNHLSILFYRIEPRQAETLDGIIDELTRQMMDQIRSRFPECCMAALDIFRPLPLNYYVRHLGQPTRGKFASLCFSDSGETCAGMTDMLGGRIQDVTHYVPTWRPPGLTVLFWSFNGRLCVLLSWVEDCLTPNEVEMLERGLRSALLREEMS